MISSCSHCEANLKYLPSEFYWIWFHLWNSSVMFFPGIANQIRWYSSSNSPNEIRAQWFGIMWQLHATCTDVWVSTVMMHAGLQSCVRRFCVKTIKTIHILKRKGHTDCITISLQVTVIMLYQNTHISHSTFNYVTFLLYCMSFFIY